MVQLLTSVLSTQQVIWKLTQHIESVLVCQQLGNTAQCGATAAYDPVSQSVIGGAVSTVSAGSTGVNCPAELDYGGDVTGYLAGIKYKVTPALRLRLRLGTAVKVDNTHYINGVNYMNGYFTKCRWCKH
jgi:hypothetical protein